MFLFIHIFANEKLISRIEQETETYIGIVLQITRKLDLVALFTPGLHICGFPHRNAQAPVEREKSTALRTTCPLHACHRTN